MQEFWFDTRNGTQLVGWEAVFPRLMEGSHDVVRLIDILEAEDFPFGPYQYAKLDEASWEPRDYYNYGQWVLNLICKDEEKAKPLAQEHLVRLHRLGIGPHFRRVLKHNQAKYFSELRQNLGSPPHERKGEHAYWTTRDFIRYAEALAAELGRRPRAQDYDEVAAKRGGPTSKIIQTHVPGGVGVLSELIGYPNTRQWGAEECIDWGARVMAANEGRRLTSVMAIILAKRERGPSDTSIRKKCGSWKTFAEGAEEEFRRMQGEEQAAREVKLMRYGQMLCNGTLPSSFVALKKEKDLFRAAGKFLVAGNVAPYGLSDSKKIELATASAERFIRILIEKFPHLTAGKIEIIALSLGVFDDIWPPPSNRHLYVPPTTYEAYRKRLRAYNHPRRSRTRLRRPSSPP